MLLIKLVKYHVLLLTFLNYSISFRVLTDLISRAETLRLRLADVYVNDGASAALPLSQWCSCCF